MCATVQVNLVGGRLSEKPVSEDYIRYDSICMTFQKEKKRLMIFSKNRSVGASCGVRRDVAREGEHSVVMKLFRVLIVVVVTQTSAHVKIY